jgi:hypothetical protein
MISFSFEASAGVALSVKPARVLFRKKFLLFIKRSFGFKIKYLVNKSVCEIFFRLLRIAIKLLLCHSLQRFSINEQ